MSAKDYPKIHSSEGFIDCLSQFLKMGATWEVTQDRETTGSDVVVRIMPTRREAASIDARFETDFGVYLLFGVISQFEVPLSRGYYTGRDWLTELGMLCRSVATGNFQEKLTYIGEKVVYCRHQLALEDGTIIRESWGARPLFPEVRPHTIERHYVAYGPG